MGYNDTIMNKRAVELFTRYEVHSEHDKLVDEVVNCGETDICRMERAVADILDPSEAMSILKMTLGF